MTSLSRNSTNSSETRENNYNNESKELVITFPTTHDMLRAEAILNSFISCESVPSPPESKSKCTTALVIDKKNEKKAKTLMEKENIKWEEIFPYASYSQLIDRSVLDKAKTTQLYSPDNDLFDSHYFLEIFKRMGRLTKEDLKYIFSLKKNELSYFQELFQKILTPKESWVIPLGSCEMNCKGCILSRQEDIDISVLDVVYNWMIEKYKEDFIPLAFVYGQGLINEASGKLISKLDKLNSDGFIQGKLPLIYLGKEPMNLPMELLTKGTALSCRDHLLNKKDDDIIREILFLKENPNQIIASQSLIPFHFQFDGLNEKDKAKILQTTIALRLTLGNDVDIGVPEIKENDIKDLGESIIFKWWKF